MSVHKGAAGADVTAAFNQAIELARTALGVSSPGQMLFYFHPTYCDGGDELSEVVAVGAGTRSGQLQASRLSSGGNGAAILTPDYSSSAPAMIPTGAAKGFWIGGYFSVPSFATAAAGQISGVIMIDPTAAEIAVAGMRGDSNTANFVAWANAGAGAFINSGVALDATKRLHEFYRPPNGSVATYKINGVQVGSTSDLRPAANCNPGASARSGAVVTTCDVGWWAGAAIRE